MGLKNILKRVFTDTRKVVICGLDNAGKSTIVSFLENGTFMDHTPTMGKAQTTLEVQGVKIDLVDMGGQKDFRSLWLGEMGDAECVIYMVDGSAPERFKEAKTELWKLVPSIKNKALIILINKCDKDDVASIREMIDALDLMKLKSFELLQISCKTGFGIVNAFSKIYNKITGQQLGKRIAPKALTIFDQGGVPLTTAECKDVNEAVLRGGLYSAIQTFVKESFNAELNQLKLDKHLIIFQRSKHLMGSIILDESETVDAHEAETGLRELLQHLENMCPEIENSALDPTRIEYLVQQFSTNIFA